MSMYACEGETPYSICVCFWQRIEYRSTDHRMSTVYYGFPHRYIVYFFLTVSQKCHIHIIYDESRSKNTPYDEVKSKWICLVHQKKRNMLSSPLNNYHVHLKYQFSVRLHLLSICAMLINVDSLHICIHIYFSD
jgi:hypothetical protein